MSLRLDWCSYEAAKYAVSQWHYTKQIPGGKLAKVGVWENGRFIGAVLFGNGANSKLVHPYGLKSHQGCELVRVALDSHKAPVSQIISIAIRLLKKRFSGLQLIVSFADPGEGHRGGIYQAGNWIYTGESAKDRFPVIDGRIAHPRTLSNRIANGTIRSRQDVSYVSKLGKHRYLYPLTDTMREQVLKLAKPYPIASEAGDDSLPGEQRRGSGDPDAPLSQTGKAMS